MSQIISMFECLKSDLNFDRTYENETLVKKFKALRRFNCKQDLTVRTILDFVEKEQIVKLLDNS